MTDMGTLDDAYAEQLRRMRNALGARVPVGWKVAFNDAAVQQRLGIDGPLAGWLDPAGLLESGARVPCPPGARFRIEAEIAVRLATDVQPGSIAAELVAEVAPALEVVDYARPADDLGKMVEHSFFHAATILGAWAPFASLAAPSSALKDLRVNDESLGGAVGGRVPDDIGPLLVRLAEVLGRYGETLRAGQIVICGSFVDPAPVAEGATVEADFGVLGRVSCSFGA